MTDWYFVNLILPPLLPILLLQLLQLFNLPQALMLRVHPLTVVKDGQLCWVAMMMCVNTLYDLKRVLHITREIEPWYSIVFWSTVLIFLASGLIAAVGAVFPLSMKTELGAREYFCYYRVLLVSVVLTIIAALLYSQVHTFSRY